MPRLELSNLHLSIEGITLLDNIHLSLTGGSIVGLLGPNGAGKSTLMKVLSGLVKPNEGELILNGKALTNFEAFREHASFTIDTPSFYPFLTAKENLEIIGRIHNDSRQISDLLKEVGLENEANKKVAHFSTGMKQRLALAQGLMGDKEWLFLDEPFNGLDPLGVKELNTLLRQLRQKGKTLVISSHLLNDLEQLADHFLLLSKGQLVLQMTKEALLSAAREVCIEFKASFSDQTRELMNNNGARWENNKAYLSISENKQRQLLKKLIEMDDIPIQIYVKDQLQKKYLEIIQ